MHKMGMDRYRSRPGSGGPRTQPGGSSAGAAPWCLTGPRMRYLSVTITGTVPVPLARSPVALPMTAPSAATLSVTFMA